MGDNSIMDDLLAALPLLPEQHIPGAPVYNLLKKVARREIEARFSGVEPQAFPFGPFGNITLPYFKMGAVDSLNLFDIDELIIFAFYMKHRARYHRALDIGANIGLHSIMMSRCGFEVRAFEPDPVHFGVLQNNLGLNECSAVTPINAAVSDRSGSMEFVRLKGNTTGSHLAGSKANPYGDLDRFPVAVEAIQAHLEWADLAKIDAEGHEKQIILSTRPEQWRKVDALVEISSPTNAAAIFDHFKGSGVSLFSQKTGWKRVAAVADVPVSHHEGTLLMTSADDVWS